FIISSRGRHTRFARDWSSDVCSSDLAVVAIAQAKRWGAQVTAETCPQYLLLSDGDYPVHGPAMKALPPIRSAEDRQALWQGLLQDRKRVVDGRRVDTRQPQHNAQAFL